MSSKMSFRIAALCGATALALAACGGPGGSSDEGGPIKVGIIADLTGATGDVGTPYNEGMLDYIDWRNEDGGVEGRKLQADSNDYAYEVPKAEQLYKKYVADGAVVIQGWGTGDSEALSAKVAADELPFMSGSLAEPLTDPKKSPFNFVNVSTYSDQMRVALNWINKDSGGNGKVAVFHSDSPFGTAPVGDGADWIEEKGYDLGFKAYPMPATANFAGLLSQAKSQGAKYIVIQNVSSPAAQVAKDIKAQGLDMKVVCLNWCSDELFIKTAGADAAEGSIMVTPIAPPSADKPGNAEPEAYLKSKGSSLEEKGLHYLQGWYTMHAMAEGIEAAIKAGGDLDGAAIRKGLEEIGTIDTGGVMGAIEYSKDSHRGSTSSGIYQVTDGVMKPVEENAKP